MRHHDRILTENACLFVATFSSDLAKRLLRSDLRAAGFFCEILVGFCGPGVNTRHFCVNPISIIPRMKIRVGPYAFPSNGPHRLP